MDLKSAIQKELAEATEIEPSRKRDETITDQNYMARLVRGTADLSDKDWNKLSPEAQAWHNDCVDAAKAKKDLPPFPDLPKEEKAEKSTRRGSSDKPKDPAEGDSVVAITKRGKTVTGVLKERDEKEGIVIITTDDGDEEFVIDRLESLTMAGGGSDKVDEPEEPAEPEVGATVTVTTARDKIVTGKITELTDDDIVLEDAAGEVHEFAKSRLKSVVVKVTAEKPASRRGSSDDKGKDKGDEKPKGKAKGGDDDAGVSVTLRMRQLICDEPDAKKEEIAAKLKKEGHEFKDGTLQIAYSDTQRIFGLLRDRKMMK